MLMATGLLNKFMIYPLKAAFGRLLKSMERMISRMIYTKPEVRPLTVALERGFAASVETGFEMPSYNNEDVSNNWK